MLTIWTISYDLNTVGSHNYDTIVVSTIIPVFRLLLYPNDHNIKHVIMPVSSILLYNIQYFWAHILMVFFRDRLKLICLHWASFGQSLDSAMDSIRLQYIYWWQYQILILQMIFWKHFRICQVHAFHLTLYQKMEILLVPKLHLLIALASWAPSGFENIIIYLERYLKNIQIKMLIYVLLYHPLKIFSQNIHPFIQGS